MLALVILVILVVGILILVNIISLKVDKHLNHISNQLVDITNLLEQSNTDNYFYNQDKYKDKYQ